MKNDIKLLKDYFNQFSDDELALYRDRFVQNFFNDIFKALETIELDVEKGSDIRKNLSSKIDKWLKSAGNIDEFYGMIDQIQDHVEKEYTKRFVDATG